MIPFEAPGASDLVETEGCRATLWFPAYEVVATRITGHVTASVARALYALVDAHPPRPVEGFLHLAGLETFDWEARAIALRYNLKHRPDRMRLHLLVRSPIVALGVRIFRLALGDAVEIHTDTTAFEAAYGLAVKRRTRLHAAS